MDIQEIIDELSNHISKINHFNEAPIKKGVIDCLQRLKEALSKQNKDTEILDYYDENIVGCDDKNYIEHFITSPLLFLFDVNDEVISEADNIRDLITKAIKESE